MGDSPYTAPIVSLNDRMLPNPAAHATSLAGRSVVSSRIRAVCARCVRAIARSPAPSSSVTRRLRCRSLYPSAAATPATPTRSTAPSATSRIERATTSPRTFHSADPGTASGRHRRHARKPSRWAAAAVRKKVTFPRFGVIAGQLGRQ